MYAIPQMLDLFFIAENEKMIRIFEEEYSPLANDTDRNIYRFNIAISTKSGGVPARICVELQQSDAWDKPHVRQIFNTP